MKKIDISKKIPWGTKVAIGKNLYKKPSNLQMSPGEKSFNMNRKPGSKLPIASRSTKRA